MIFQRAVDPDSLHWPDYYKVVKNPIDLETIKKKLMLDLYSSLKEFTTDFRTMFENFRKYIGKDHKFISYCNAVEKRFERALEKHENYEDSC